MTKTPTKPLLDLIHTELAIKLVKDNFEKNLAKKLNLIRVSAPLLIHPSTGLNDDLSGVERPVIFDLLHDKEPVAIVQSLAKWKRYALSKYQIASHAGLYTDMNAIRKDEKMDALHSIYVDQWDWEKKINLEDRNLSYLKKTVKQIYHALLQTQKCLLTKYPQLVAYIPKQIIFMTTAELEKKYPLYSPKEREYLICKEKKAVFLMQIGHQLPLSHASHDLRAPDYDDWNLNGDLLIYYPVIDQVVELSSMGIRVDENSLKEQLKLTNQEHKSQLMYHQMLLNHQLPLTIGGGIGQSRICMLLLNKRHIGEVQSSIWSKKVIEECQKDGIVLL